MPKLCDPQLCNGCSACAQICPHNCISMEPDPEGFLQPRVNEDSCVDCQLCTNTCPVLNLPAFSKNMTGCYAAINKSDPEREKASSGGIFLLLARWILERGGVVFGAAFNKDFTVSHQYAESEEAVYAFCGSKYVQSRIGDSYRKVREFLVEGRYVLFTGTPCQVLGLYQYLGGTRERLLTADIICHGVPSPEVWKQYVNIRAEQDNGGILPEQIRFRAKETGWSSFSVQFIYSDKIYSKRNFEDTYMHGFLNNLYLRPSCYNCIAKGIDRISDFTLADFWGVQRIQPDMYDNRGTSLVLLHTDKAVDVWNVISTSIRAVSVEAETAVNANSAAICSVKMHSRRAEFFRRYQSEDFEKLVWELVPVEIPPKLTIWRRIRGKLGRVYRRLRKMIF